MPQPPPALFLLIFRQSPPHATCPGGGGVNGDVRRVCILTQLKQCVFQTKCLVMYRCFEKVPKVVIYGNKVSPSGGHKTSKPPPDHASKTFPCPFSADHEHKSLLLNHNDYFTARQQGNTHGFTNSMFTKCPREGMWFVIHPDFRMEPGRMRGVGPG